MKILPLKSTVSSSLIKISLCGGRNRAEEAMFYARNAAQGELEEGEVF